jgi:hypothetical protein
VTDGMGLEEAVLDQVTGSLGPHALGGDPVQVPHARRDAVPDVPAPPTGVAAPGAQLAEAPLVPTADQDRSRWVDQAHGSA